MYKLADSPRERKDDRGCWGEGSRDRPHRIDGRFTPPDRGLDPEFRFFPPKKPTFDALVAQWREDAIYESMTHRVAMLPAYQAMVGMGPEALPLILARLVTDPSPHWFWALRAIAHHDPAAGKTTVPDAVEAWLEWGRSVGHVPG